MKRMLSLLQRLPVRKIPVRRVLMLFVLGMLGLLGLRTPPAPVTPVPKAVPGRIDGSAPAPPGSFQAMRPRLGDHMTLPRIGFRWAFDGVRAWTHMGGTGTASEASMVPSFPSGDSIGVAVSRARQQVRFLLHLVGPGGGPEIRQETTQSQVRLNLRNTLPPGEYQWWVEAFVPGMPPVSSPRERFALTP
jgi:hypothetical protein